MKLKTVILRNFRGYANETRISVADLTALIGRNDVGKSTVLEALEIFFNSKSVKIDRQDASVYGDPKDVRIGCVFSDLPVTVVLDESSETSLADECLLNDDGDLEIHKQFNCELKTPQSRTLVVCQHPTAEHVRDLLALKAAVLKARLKDLGVDTTEVDMRSNVAMRRALRSHCPDLALALTELDVEKTDYPEAKKVWEALQRFLPLYALFCSDRPSRDDDSEVQDPMKAAVEQAIKGVEQDLESIKQRVQQEAEAVATATLGKLREMDEKLAAELIPRFREEPKWAGLFKLTLTGDDDIPINKRGSGVRRLLLLSFFRADAERRQRQRDCPNVIYAVEEPETSQHPANQSMLCQAFQDLSLGDGCQVLLTTHVPALAGLLPVEAVRHLRPESPGTVGVQMGDDRVYEAIATALGVLPEPGRPRAVICVEGPSDVAFLRRMSHILHDDGRQVIDLSTSEEVPIVPLGGGTLRQWVEQRYLRGFGLPEVHIYDRDDAEKPKYRSAADAVNRRTDGSWAVLTRKREMENYLHPDLLRKTLNCNVEVGADADVPTEVAKALYEADASTDRWDDLSEEKKRKKSKSAKHRLLSEVLPLMTVAHLRQADPDGEIEGWLKRVGETIG